MKHTKILLGLVLALSILVTPVAAEEEVDKVILAGEANYPDAVVGSSVSEKLGIPLILTEVEELPEEAESALDEYAPEEVIVIGGPAVVSEEIIEQLREDYEVSRLWGMSRYGTAQEIVERFWPEGAESVVLVEDRMDDERGEILAASRAFAGERPVIPIPEGKVPAGITNQLEEMGVEEVDVVGIDPEGIREELGDLGIGVGEEVRAQNREQLRNEARERANERVEAGDRLLVVASQGHRDVISAPSVPDHRPFLVSSEDEIDELIDLIEERDVEEVKIVGQPELAGEIAEALEDVDVEVDLVVERATEAVAQASELAKENRPEFAERFAQRNQEWRQRIEEADERVQERAGKEIERTRGIFEDWDGEELEGRVDEAEAAFEEGDYQRAREIAQEVRTEARGRRYEEVREDPGAIAEEVRRETDSVRERTQELREMNEEFGEKMQEEMTIEERIQVIEEFRGRRREKVHEIVEQAGYIDREETEDVSDWIRRAGREPGPP